MQTIDISYSQEIYTVSRLNHEVRFLLEEQFPLLWIEGEISNFVAPTSGHWYFSLKDTHAQVRCAMFRPQNRLLTFTPKDGMQVLLKARISLYEGRGDYQLLIEHLEEAGLGKLQQAFLALKNRLQAAGLFDAIHKKTLPTMPKVIGIITSPTGAAIRDILSVLKRRYCSAPIIIYPTLVQGDLAAPAIVKAIKTANARQECDVLILARGGGSLEDLWPFNEESVAQAIFQSRIPIISGVGHEIDFTIADFVADVRAPTPSAAAELISPDINKLLLTLDENKKYFIRLIQQVTQQLKQQIYWLKKQLQQQHPKRRLTQQMQQIDLQEAALIRLQDNLIFKRKVQLATLYEKLQRLTPQHKLHSLQHVFQHQYHILKNTLTNTLQKYQQQLTNLAGKLDGLSPLATLKRGFSITSRKQDQHILRSSQEIKPGETVQIQLMQGKLDCTVEKIS